MASEGSATKDKLEISISGCLIFALLICISCTVAGAAAPELTICPDEEHGIVKLSHKLVDLFVRQDVLRLDYGLVAESLIQVLQADSPHCELRTVGAHVLEMHA
jgi:hypothetical protein